MDQQVDQRLQDRDDEQGEGPAAFPQLLRSQDRALALVEVRLLVLQVPRSRHPFCPGVFTGVRTVVQLRVVGDERLESDGPVRAEMCERVPAL